MSQFFDSPGMGWSEATPAAFGRPEMDAVAGSLEFDSRGRFAVFIDDNPNTISDDFSDWSSTQLKAIYRDEFDIDVLRHAELFEADPLINMYYFDLIFAVRPGRNPQWWPQATFGRFRYRIVILGEWTWFDPVPQGWTGGVQIQFWIESVSNVIGMKLFGTTIGWGCLDDRSRRRLARRSAYASQRFAVIPGLHYANTNWIVPLDGAGARDIYELESDLLGDPSGFRPMMAETVLNGVNWVLSGDSTAFYQDPIAVCNDMPEFNADVFLSFAWVAIGDDTGSVTNVASDNGVGSGEAVEALTNDFLV